MTGRPSPWRIAGWSVAAAILLAPLVAMRFTDEVDWDALDFVFMGALVGGVGLGLELAVRSSGDAAYRAAAGVALAAAFLLIWINAAVGLVGGEQEDANPLFAGVPAVALAGALAARFRAAGLALAMAAAALAQAAVPAVAWVLVPAARPLAFEPKVMALTGGFVVLWLLAAALFRRAARRGSPAGAGP